jgi:two-component system phosphate regulon sensor histidine kinase PhoR
MQLPGWLYPPKFADEERTRIASLVNILIWAILTILLLNEVGRFIIAPRIDSVLWNRVAAILLLLGFRWLMRKGRVYLAGFSVCFLIWIVFAYYMTVGGGLRSFVLLDLGIPLVIASLLVGTRGTVIFGGICILFLLVLYWGDVTGRFVSLEPVPTESRLLVSTVTTFGSLAIVGAIGAYSTRKALVQLYDSKQILREQNELLQHEIAERKRAQEELARLASIVETTLDFVGMADDHGKVTYINQGGRKLLGFSENADVSKTVIFDYHPPDVGKMIIEQALPVVAQSGAWTGETVLILHDKREIPVLQTILAHRDEPGNIVYYSTILHDLSEHKQVEKQNLEFVVERERFTAFKDFLATISHDLKTPLTILDLNLHLLEKSDDPAQRHRKINSIREQTKLMEQYILDLLALSHLEQVPDLQFTEVNFAALLDNIVKQLQPKANGKNLTFTLNVIPNLPNVQGDVDELERALGNLVENAIIYTPDSGSVTVSASCEANMVVFSIADTGIGISAEALPHIFEQSFRAREARAFHSGGTGFGLAIVKKVIEIHHGRIEVQSTLNRGSTFHVYLPFAQR